MYLTLNTGNAKILGDSGAAVATLSLPIANTCPKSCALRDQGCYAQGGRLALHERRLATLSEGRNVLQVARVAAKEIEQAASRGSARGRALRLFQVGDARTPSSARALAQAARTWLRAGGASVWGYTHAWRDVPRDAWRGVSVLASVETVEDGAEAQRRGYVPARVVEEHPSDGRAFAEGGVTWIPCPEQTRGVPCVKCRLCWDSDALRARGRGISFAAHGARKAVVKRRLNVVQNGGCE